MNLLLCAMKWRKFHFEKRVSVANRWSGESQTFAVPRSGVEKVKIRSRTDRAVCCRRTFALCHEVAWKRQKFGRGPVEQCVDDFCSLPRGGVRKKNSVDDRQSSVSGTFALCHVVAEKKKRKNWSRTDIVGRRMPRGALRKKD